MFGNMFEQMQKAQQEMMKIQSELKNKTVEASVGGGKVIATANGNQQIVKVHIDPELMAEDPEFLEDMIVAAVNQALEKSKNLFQKEMSQLTNGLDVNNIMKMFQK
ncbi:YbaB/EbfC family nucleoid-associated protein [Candidatus Uabimicrobium amorphum]|uniref:Nucleoid-associated protein UABAM_01441 n=1 Tax=Uabimicrobium amorphum TaxID=2596890 RepID=A0A5S9IKA1_UABAM|nr:YbaB/EbfC family nucleoid-associated protein [Candidatus Uabimicrobium amorphum]BBM83091.1 nucleoid-associated protein [Candidatus Uabimicrobium amorphum]